MFYREKRLPRQADHVKAIIRFFGGPTAIAKVLDANRSVVYSWVNVIPEKYALKLYRYGLKHQLGLSLKDLSPEIFVDGWHPEFNDENDYLGKETC